jgi:nucleoside-diphosphate-sugar epimerase
MSRRLLVLGCGYVGAEVCRQAKSLGWKTLGVVRSEASRDRLRAEGLPVEAADILAGGHEALEPAPDLVVYALSAGGGGEEAYRAAYAAGPARVAAWAARAGARALVLTSSTGVYRQEGEVDESSPAGGDGPSDRIVEGERAVLAAGVPSATVLRLGGLYGPGRHYLLDQLRRGERTVGGPVSTRINYLHRDDAAAAVLAACAAPAGAWVYNVTDGHPTTKAELAAWICERLGGPAPTFDPAAPAGPRARRTGRATPDRRVRSEAIRRELGWQPRFATVFEGLSPLL